MLRSFLRIRINNFIRVIVTITPVFLLILCFGIMPLTAQPQQIDEDYTAKIHEFTTDDHFITKFVDYLPASVGIPTPLDVIGHIAGAADVLTYSEDIYRYMRALAEASPRVEVFSAGTSEEGREMILVAISDESAIRDLWKYKEIMAELADPRVTDEAKAQRLIETAKPIYWATGSMHASETGSPEMLMELAYRIAADESPFIKSIRDNMIVLITPLLDVDGHDKQVDLHMAPRRDPEASFPSRLIYWGKYVAHDDNRDNLSLSLELSKHLIGTFLEYHPLVMHDLHESASHLYISTGTGPYNAWLDPIVIDEWHQLAYKEVDALTREGVPGVWTHAFYDGWAPSYGFYAANGHNAIGRFYETQGAGNAETKVITTRGDRTWYRPNPPIKTTLWSIRNNVNLQQSAILVGMNHIATNKTTFLENFYIKSKRSVAKAYNEGPAAYIFPADDPRPGQSARLLKLLQWQGVEIHKAKKDFTSGETEYPKGSYIVRMDQPYSRMADMMLDRQYFNTGDSRPYDDVGWMLGPLYNAKTVRVEDTEILSVKMDRVYDIVVPGGVERLDGRKDTAFIINHNADNPLATFRFEFDDIVMYAAEEAFEIKEREFKAGSFIITADQNSENLKSILEDAGNKYGFTAYSVSDVPEVPKHKLSVPRVALMHTWQTTQSEGWVRIALDELKIPYDYISVQDVRDDPDLRSSYDVILFGPSRGDALGIMKGVTGDKPVLWKKTDITPNLGRQDSSDDIRGGLELEGVTNLRDFVKDGGLLLTIANSSTLPIYFGLSTGITIKSTPGLWAGGGVYKSEILDKKSPIVYGYDKELGVYFSRAPVFAKAVTGRRRYGSGSETGRVSGRGSLTDPDIPQGRPRDLGKATIKEFNKKKKEEEKPDKVKPQSKTRIVARFVKDVDELLISGGLANGEALAGSPAIVDCKLGEGHVILFSINPMWRHETHGSFFLVFNSIMNYDHLDAGKK